MGERHDKVHRVSRNHLIGQDINCFLIKAFGLSIEDGEVFGILLFSDHMSDEGANGRLDEIGAILELC